MSSQDVGWAFLFLVIVGLIVAVGLVVGIIAAGRIDRLMAPRPATKQDEPAGAEPASGGLQPAPGEEEQP